MIKSLFHWKAASWAPSLFGVSNDLFVEIEFYQMDLFIPWLIDIDSKRKYKITHLSNEIADLSGSFVVGLLVNFFMGLCMVSFLMALLLHMSFRGRTVLKVGLWNVLAL
jgi:hypothetical protein